MPIDGPDPFGTADELAREAEAEALAAEARAEAARIRAAELRRELDAVDVADVAFTDIPLAAPPPPPPPTGLLRTIAVAATTLLTAGLLGAT